MTSIVHYIKSKVDPRAFYSKVFEDGIKWPSTGTEARVKSPFREERTPSFSLNGDTGAWFDHGSGEGGKSIVTFWAKYRELKLEPAAEEIYELMVRPVIPNDRVRKWSRALANTPSFLQYVKSRFVTDQVIAQFQLGTNGHRIIFPIRDEFGICVNAKLYLPNSGSQPKCINYKLEDEPRPYGSPPMLYPLGVLLNTPDSEDIVVCEGEWDTLALISMGVMAVTASTGCKSWAPQYNDLFKGRNVVVAYDNDKDGDKYSSRVVEELASVARSIGKITIPQAVHGHKTKDVSDWIKHEPKARTEAFWRKLISKAEPIVDNPQVEVSAPAGHITVSLDQASKAAYFGKQIRVDALVTGKDTSPYILPSKARVSCSRKCESCPLANSNKPFREVDISSGSVEILDLVDSTKAQVNKTIVSMAGMPMKPSCCHQVEVVQTFNVEQLLLIPSIESNASQYVMRTSWFVGHGLASNRTYRFSGITTTDPSTQHSTHLFTSATPIQGEIETFELTDEVRQGLMKFQAISNEQGAIEGKLASIAAWQSKHITKIRKRPDLHIVVDLVFHSVASFSFNGEKVKRGMMDVLIIGDTRCGKGYVSEGLSRHYGLGEIASGENCSFAGLVGGCESVNKRFIVKWGIIPLNNGRLVVIDEASALAEDDFGKLSRVRSEGVAEISKIVREQTMANTRLIWLSNCRSGRAIMTYNYGVQAVRELVGAAEDISRFDLALSVASGEVEASIINTVRTEEKTVEEYSPQVCRNMVMWAWSRRSDQVQFTSEATSCIIDEAIRLGRMYSSTIPLIQAENVRIKIAKISCAIAARLYSCDESGEVLVVHKGHVLAATRLINSLYSKPSMSYDAYSAVALEKSVIQDPEKLGKVFDGLGDARLRAIRGLAALNVVTADSLTDWTGDVIVSKLLLSELVLLGCVTRNERDNRYLKNQPFTAWLREQERSENANGTRVVALKAK